MSASKDIMKTKMTCWEKIYKVIYKGKYLEYINTPKIQQ